MESELKTKKLLISGMSCVSCQNKIERKLEKTNGIPFAQVNYSTQTAVVTYDANIITISEIVAIIERLDYKVINDSQPEPNNKKAVGIFIIVLSAYMIMQQLGFQEFDRVMLNELIKVIYIHKPEIVDGKKEIQIDIHYNFVGKIN